MAEDRIPVLEGEVDALREERETLLTRIAELEAHLQICHRHRLRAEEAEAEVARLRDELAKTVDPWARDKAEVASLREANRAACDALGWIKDHDGSPPSFRMAAENALRVQEALTGGGQ